MTGILSLTLKSMNQRKYLYIFSIFTMAVIKALLDVVTSFFVNRLYSCIENHTMDLVPELAIKNMILGIILITIWRYFTIVYNNEAKRATANLQKKVYQKALKLPMAYYEEHAHGGFLSRLSYNIDKASDIYGSRFRRVVTPFISVIVYLIAMFVLNWRMSILLLSTNVVLLLLNLTINRPMKKISEKILKTKSEETGVFLNILHGAEVIRIYAMKDMMKKKSHDVLTRWNKEQAAKNLLVSILESFNSGFDLLCSVLFLGIGTVMINNGIIALGELIAIYVLYTAFNFHFLQIGKYIPELTECLVYMKDLFDFLESEEETELYTTDNIEFSENTAAISTKGITFAYSNEHKVLNDVSVDFESGKLTAITGKSGCGKSTLLKIILGFYCIDSGQLYLYGNEIRSLGYKQVRNCIAYVPQEPYLFNVSIAENISYGKQGANTQEIINAAKAANAHEFIMKQHNGYDTIVTKGGRNLSGGERQRIAIARAILKDAPIILMDEATSALDNESEKSVNDFLSTNSHKKTVIVVAHRATTIERASVRIELSITP